MKLAIKGHPTRGKEVIEILEMMGGKNNCDSIADNLGLCYLIDDEFDICAHYFGYDDYEDGELNIFTLEEFLEKYPFKVGDKVIVYGYNYLLPIIAMRWDDNTVKYLVSDDNNCNLWYTAEDIESMSKIGKTNFMQLGKTIAVCFNKENYENEVELQLGDYEIEVRDGKTYAVLKKPKYPKTFEECLNMLYCKSVLKTIIGHKAELLFNLEKLLICRDAYWKIAGEEMGLGKPWGPNWTTFDGMPAIFGFRHSIVCDSIKNQHCLLVFPTEEMRDTFYNNFKDLIEQCKELL